MLNVKALKLIGEQPEVLFVSGMMARTKENVAFLFTLALTVSVALECTSASDPDSSFAAARKEMVQKQIVARGITSERLLRVLNKVERHKFVDKGLRRLAYSDFPLPIEAGQTISQPYIVALMTDLLELKGDEKVLEIGTGSGYQAAILGELAAEVYTIEIIDTLAKNAEQRLKELGYKNITVRVGDGFQGWKEEAPFDCIIVTCAPAEIPQPLLDQLADSGRLVIPVGTDWQELILVRKNDGELTRTRIAPVRFVPMTGESEKHR